MMALAVSGCGDGCERLCRDVSFRLDACMGSALTWPDVGARSRSDFLDQCRLAWDRTSAELTTSDLAEAVDICVLGQDELRTLSCDELTALYAAQP